MCRLVTPNGKQPIFREHISQKLGKHLSQLHLSSHLYIVDTLIAVAAEKHLLNNREEALALVGPEGERAVAVGLDDPTVEHVMRCDDRRGTITHVEYVLLVQDVADPLALEAIYGREVKRRLATGKEESLSPAGRTGPRTYTRCN